MSCGREPAQLPLRRSVPTEVPADYAALRRAGPVCPVLTPVGDPGWLALGHAAAKQVMTDRRLSRAAACAPQAPRMLAQPPNPDVILYMDAPRHSRVRRVASAALDALPLPQLRELVEGIADDLLAAMARSGGPVDLNAAFARPLPLRVICAVLGVSDADMPALTRWTEAILSLGGEPQERMAAMLAIRDHFGVLVDERLAQPADDAVSRMLAASALDAAGPLDRDELVSLTMTLLIAGHESSVTVLANAVLLLLADPEQLADLRADPALMPQAVEELLRLAMPGTSPFLRVATEDLDIAGCPVRAGEAVTVNYESAHRDPTVFRDADRLDLRRRSPAGSSLYFGFGPHFCLGAQIARTQLEVGLAALLARFPALRLAVPPAELAWRDDAALGGFAAVPVTW
ncbi:cytochrome P450 RapN/nocardicin N-oxygenase [Jatrophihabitans endophyticus]|uniref:Cytochrome P450 RapN/nocardicin N-oxygenase n=1 Tax=Jatrophihabitans endophyticus TaxID=1206085 RepID=A0A1M5RFF0_9ACTN|nr:cytochrome P450 [Jatrophihabitans endophyticus]SHH24826.1 cytochrome P450 RapN/nocardicin N-oxygenase [Jatrophihabitans endophyticus]